MSQHEQAAAQAVEMSALDLLTLHQETFEDAAAKVADESFTSIKTIKLKEGTTTVRILPLVPKLENGTHVPQKGRVGYEHGIKEMVLKFADQGKKVQYAGIVNSKLVFENIKEDLVDAYVRLANEHHGSDDEFIKAISADSFDGGLKWSHRRYMYAIDESAPTDGIQLLSLSYSQYRDLETMKMNVWEKLKKSDPNPKCPISSPKNAYALEIVKKKEGKKVSYAFALDYVSGYRPLTGDEAQALVKLPLLCDHMFRYSNYHLSATIQYLKRLDSKFDVKIMSRPEIAETIEDIKQYIKADDTRQFTYGGGEDAENTASLQDLWDRYDDMVKNDIADKSDEGNDLKAAIREFIEDNQLDDVEIRRGMTIEDMLEAVQSAVDGEVPSSDNSSPKPTTAPAQTEPAQVDEPEGEEEDEEEGDGAPSAQPTFDPAPERPVREERGERRVRRGRRE